MSEKAARSLICFLFWEQQGDVTGPFAGFVLLWSRAVSLRDFPTICCMMHFNESMEENTNDR